MPVVVLFTATGGYASRLLTSAVVRKNLYWYLLRTRTHFFFACELVTYTNNAKSASSTNFLVGQI